MKLLSDAQLEWSSVVANNAMNRKRGAIGVNSYEKEIKINPIDYLAARHEQADIRWTDLCCGEGNALIQAAGHFSETDIATQVMLTGIDLVDFFAPHEASPILHLQQLNLNQWAPSHLQDLVTVVHGLHYLGDKIELILKAVAALKKDGVFVANLDMTNILLKSNQHAQKALQVFFKENQIQYNARTKLIKVVGGKIIANPFRYLGADDKAGPNYTGQPVVNSYYEL